jgi:RNA polymerase sigma factor (sigma-70 family)
VLEPSSKHNSEREAEAKQLLTKLRDLAPSYRELLYLRFVKGLPLCDIATRVGISVNAVALRISRGVKELRKKAGY